MTNSKFPKPDYQFWAKTETWSLNQSALLLHGIDPHHCRSLRLADKNIPLEYVNVQKTYFVLRSIPWKERHHGYYFPNIGVHPMAIIYEAETKNLRVPAPLRKLIAKRFQKEQASNAVPVKQNSTESQQEQPLLNREKKSLLKGIAILVELLIDKRKNHRVIQN